MHLRVLCDDDQENGHEFIAAAHLGVLREPPHAHNWYSVQSLIYAGHIIEDDKQLRNYNVPPVGPHPEVCKARSLCVSHCLDCP